VLQGVAESRCFGDTQDGQVSPNPVRIPKTEVAHAELDRSVDRREGEKRQDVGKADQALCTFPRRPMEEATWGRRKLSAAGEPLRVMENVLERGERHPRPSG